MSSKAGLLASAGFRCAAHALVKCTEAARINKLAQEHTNKINMGGIEGNNNSERGKKGIWLVTKEQFAALPDGTELYSALDGSRVIKGKDIVADEVRSGFMAIGFYTDTSLPKGIELKEGGYWGKPVSEDDQ